MPEKQAHNLLKNIVFELTFICSSSVYFYGVSDGVDLLIVELMKVMSIVMFEVNLITNGSRPERF